MNQISKGTIIRTVMLLVVIVNMLLKYTGHSMLPIDETMITEFLEMIISVSTIVVCYWKNNSVSKKAIKADEFLNQLKESEE